MSAAPETDLLVLAGEVRAGRVRAEQVLEGVLDDIAARDGDFNCFTAVFAEEARAQARRVDADVRAGRPAGPLAGVPFGVKNLFDVAGAVTLAGSKIRRQQPPAQADATLVRRLKDSGAILVGALNMDEFAYGFSTENAHYGATRNPHDPERIAGGSSGGSAAAVAAGLLPLTLGSDTNGSIRVPAAMCGVYGMKPTFGRLSRAGAFPFVSSLDHVGHFARSVRDLAAAYDLMQGEDAADPACAGAPEAAALPGLDEPIEGLRIGVLDGWFLDGASDEVLEGLEQAASGLKAVRGVRLPEVDRARAAAYCITAAEGANLHLPDLATRPHDFDAATRDRLLAGALMPAAVVLQAQRFRTWFQVQVVRIFEDFDVLLAPTTVCTAPRIGQVTMSFKGRETPIRPNLGVYTQPLSFIGLPVVAAPVNRPGMPVGVQIVTRPWAEALGLRVANHLERAGVLAAARLEAA
ncbi:MAG: AtzE family amidohydrolase [Caulobacteraceae bacterium]|nr:AtzE family amidohydrolase [Caulobacteraceae bacterium]